ncbi:3-hydroxyacyl-CoA dehydrogenase, partial [Pseudomonas fluorescens]
PYQVWDAVGVAKGVELMKAIGKEPAAWVTEMLEKGYDSFYTVRDGATYYYSIPDKDYVKKPGQDGFIILDNLRAQAPVFKNSGVTVHDIGDGILNVEFTSKMNSIGGDVLAGLNKAIDIAEDRFDGLVVANNGANFSVGAN